MMKRLRHRPLVSLTQQGDNWLMIRADR